MSHYLPRPNTNEWRLLRKWQRRYHMRRERSPLEILGGLCYQPHIHRVSRRSRVTMLAKGIPMGVLEDALVNVDLRLQRVQGVDSNRARRRAAFLADWSAAIQAGIARKMEI